MSKSGKAKGGDEQSAAAEEFAQNFLRLLEEGGHVAHALGGAHKADTPDLPLDELAGMANALSDLAQDWLSDPRKALEAQSALWQDYMALWNSQMRRLLGGDAEPAAQPGPGDKRFADPEWSENQAYDFIKQAYLITAKWAEKLAEDAPHLDPRARHKALFYVRQITNALSPSNFVLSNPELLRETLSSKGANLVRGMRMLAEDIERGGGKLLIRQSDMDAFEVGRNLALTPGKVIHQNELMQLIQYEPATETVLKRPLLIVPPWINKFYILDLTPEKSFVKWCTEQGHTVFVVSWVNPDRRHKDKSWEDYVRLGVVEALDAIGKATGEKQVNAVGYCVGGTMLATALALMAKERDRRIRSATLLTTQIDFTYAGDLLVFVDEDQIKSMEARMADEGYLDAGRMATAFNMLRSNDLIWPYVVNNYLKGKAPFPFDLLFWNADATRMPAANHSFYLRECYLNNNLTQGRMKLGGKTLDLGKVKVPVYNLATREDHIAPAKSAFLGSQFLGGPVRFVLSASGHIAGVVNPPARNKYQYWTGGPAKGGFEDWLERAEAHPGSWWPDWQAWIEEQDNTRVPARKPGGGPLKPIEDAPGSYVKVKSWTSAPGVRSAPPEGA